MVFRTAETPEVLVFAVLLKARVCSACLCQWTNAAVAASPTKSTSVQIPPSDSSNLTMRSVASTDTSAANRAHVSNKGAGTC